MGARLYIPSIGRFTQVDPVEGGVENNYVYPPDPVNDLDLDGNFSMRSFANIASFGSMIPGPIGMISSGVACAAYAASGDRKQALMMAVGIAAAGVGAGGAVKAFQVAKKASVGVRLAKNATRMGSKANRFAKSISPVHGKEFNMRNDLRIKPFGNWRGKTLVERLPHYHSRAPHVSSGRSGIGWHRPWQTKFRKWF